MKKLFSVCILGIGLLFASCDNKPKQTIEDLKAAANGETSASSKYFAMAGEAEKAGMPNLQKLFTATAAAEAIHAQNHLKVLADLGVTDFVPVSAEFEIPSVNEALTIAINGETDEVMTMYPVFISNAESLKNTEGAIESFKWAIEAEKKHAGFYTEALESIQANGNDAMVAGEWAICPRCGDTYKASEVPENCKLCGVESQQFQIFK